MKNILARPVSSFDSNFVFKSLFFEVNDVRFKYAAPYYFIEGIIKETHLPTNNTFSVSLQISLITLTAILSFLKSNGPAFREGSHLHENG